MVEYEWVCGLEENIKLLKWNGYFKILENTYKLDGNGKI